MIKEYNSVIEIEKEWKILCEQGNVNYCQSYLWTKYTEFFISSNIFKRMYFGTVKYFCFFENNLCPLILPMQIKKGVAHLLGWKTPNDYTGILCDKNHRRGGRNI